jgi:hypothetical protein
MWRNTNWKFWEASTEMAAPANEEELDPHCSALCFRFRTTTDKFG